MEKKTEYSRRLISGQAIRTQRFLVASRTVDGPKFRSKQPSKNLPAYKTPLFSRDNTADKTEYLLHYAFDRVYIPAAAPSFDVEKILSAFRFDVNIYCARTCGSRFSVFRNLFEVATPPPLGPLPHWNCVTFFDNSDIFYTSISFNAFYTVYVQTLFKIKTNKITAHIFVYEYIKYIEITIFSTERFQLKPSHYFTGLN